MKNYASKAILSVAPIMLGGCSTIGNFATSVLEKPTVTKVGPNEFEIYYEGSQWSTREKIWAQWDDAAKKTCPTGYTIKERNYHPTQGSAGPYISGRVKCK